MPPGPGEITSVDCDNEESAVIEGIAKVTIEDDDFGLCEFILEVTDTPPPAADTIRMRIICDNQLVHDSGILELLGQSMNIIDC